MTAFLFAEAGLRFHLYREEQVQLEHFQRLAEQQPRLPDGSVDLGHLVRPSSVPGLIYELIPGMEGVFMGTQVRINDHGFRDNNGYQVLKEEGEFRILGLGDSFMFGWGVEENERYSNLLEERLNGAESNRFFRFINTGVPGYNSAMELALLKERGLSFSPDLVVLHSVGNDYALPNFITRGPDYFGLGRSFLWDRLNGIEHGGSPELRNAPFDGGAFLSDPERVPDKYRTMVGPEAVRSAMVELSQLSHTHGFKVLVLHSGMEQPEFLALLKELQLPSVSVDRFSGMALERLGLEDIRESPFVLSKLDNHPSPQGHLLHVEVLEWALRHYQLLEL